MASALGSPRRLGCKPGWPKIRSEAEKTTGDGDDKHESLFTIDVDDFQTGKARFAIGPWPALVGDAYLTQDQWARLRVKRNVSLTPINRCDEEKDSHKTDVAKRGQTIVGQSNDRRQHQ